MNTCLRCQKALKPKQKKYCSKICSGKANYDKDRLSNFWHETPFIKHKCLCGKTFLIRECKSRKGLGKYCSRRCADIFSHLKKVHLDFSQIATKKIGYLAGLFDGEGCIHCNFTRAGRFYVGIGNTNTKIMKWLKETIPCGKIIIHRNSTENRKTCYNWTLKRAFDCYQFLVFIEPHLIAKRKKAKEVIEFLQNRYHF